MLYILLTYREMPKSQVDNAEFLVSSNASTMAIAAVLMWNRFAKQNDLGLLWEKQCKFQSSDKPYHD